MLAGMDTGRVDIKLLERELLTSAEQAFVRAILRRDGKEWQFHYLSALIGAEPPGWQEQAWEYEQIAFEACSIRAAELAALCSTTGGDVLSLGNRTVTTPPTQPDTQMTRRPSFARYDRPPLPWPVTDYEIPAVGSNGTNFPHETLVAAFGPSFPEPQSAWRAFSEGDFSLTGASGLPQPGSMLRLASAGGRIGHVHVTPTQLSAEIKGDDLTGAILELNGTEGRSATELSGPGTVTFPLPGGLPGSAWLWLKRGMSWLDYRSIEPGSGWTGDLARAGVEIDIPAEPQANVEALIAAGEGPRVEYKEQLPASSKDRRMLRTVAAFATGEGGTIVFGINRDEVTVTGLGDGDPGKMRDRLVDLIHAAVIPMPQVAADPFTIDGETVLVLDVKTGQSPPYGIVMDPGSRDKPVYFIRRGASTYPAQPSDLREAILSRIPGGGIQAPGAGWWAGGG